MKKRGGHIGLAVALVAAIVAIGCGAPPRPRAAESSVPRAAATAAERLTADVCYLASDSLGGRLEGTPGIELAADYIASQLSQIGLRPLFGDSYFQEFAIQFGFEIEGRTLLRIDDAPLDYSVLPVSGSGTVWGSAVVGTAASDPKDARLAGKVLLVQEHPELERQRWSTAGHDALLEWMKDFTTRAADVKAAAVIFVNGSEKDPEAGFHLFAIPRTYSPAPIPSLEIRYVQLETILDRQGTAPDELARMFEAAGRAGGWEELLRVQCELGLTTRPRTVVTRNVGAMLPAGMGAAGMSGAEAGPGTGGATGVGAGRTAEYVVVGAHYDGLGGGEIASSTPWRREIHNGADDNASGVGAMLEVARKMASAGGPARAVAFVAFSAEELGALGSEYFCANSPVPVDSISAFVNLDTVGRMEGGQLIVFGATSATELADLLAASNEGTGLELVPKEEVYGFSDQNPFYARRVPSVHLFTGANETYHTPDDDCGTLNFAGLASIASFAATLVTNVADAPAKLTPVVLATPPPAMAGRGRGGFLGIVPDFAYGGKGIRIKGAVAKSPAEAAGLEDGDILLAVDGRPLKDLQDLMAVLGAKGPGDQITLEVSRGSEVITKQITLSLRSAN